MQVKKLLSPAIKTNKMIRLTEEENGSATIAIGISNSLLLFSTDKIVRLQASSSYTKIFLDNTSSIITSIVLKEYEKLLSGHGFIRTHRSHLVNKKRISIINRDKIVMDDASKATVSKRKRSLLLKELNLH